MGESFPTCYEQFIEYGRHEGLFELLFQLVEDDDLSLEKAAKKAGLTVNEFLDRSSLLSSWIQEDIQKVAGRTIWERLEHSLPGEP